MEMTRSSSASVMPRTPMESRPLKTRTSSTQKRMHWPRAVVSRTSSSSRQICDVDDVVALVELHGDLAGAVDVDEVRQLVAAHAAARRGEHHVELVPVVLVLGQRHDGGDALALPRAAAC